jgi:hypothetical protein
MDPSEIAETVASIEEQEQKLHEEQEALTKARAEAEAELQAKSEEVARVSACSVVTSYSLLGASHSSH